MKSLLTAPVLLLTLLEARGHAGHGLADDAHAHGAQAWGWLALLAVAGLAWWSARRR